jgi:uncharacterized oxidoreductase
MKSTKKTILITGAGSGIGYATAKKLTEQGNTVILVGRNPEKIKKAGLKLGQTFIVCDITVESEVRALIGRITMEFPKLSILINNAGITHIYQLGEDVDAAGKARQEFETNYFAILRLTEGLIPLLKAQPEAAIVNISSNVSFQPLIILPTYSDTKAALHSHCVALRHTLAKSTRIKVFEVMPSLIDTPSTKDLGGAEHGRPASEVADAIYEGLQKDQYEIYVGETLSQRNAYFIDPVSSMLSVNDGL